MFDLYDDVVALAIAVILIFFCCSLNYKSELRLENALSMGYSVYINGQSVDIDDIDLDSFPRDIITIDDKQHKIMISIYDRGRIR